MIPESPRWLIDKGKDEQALAIIQKWHCRGDPNDPLLEFEYNEIKEALRLEKAANKSSSYIGLFRGKGNIKRMRIIIAIAFFSQWSGVSPPCLRVQEAILMSFRTVSCRTT